MEFPDWKEKDKLESTPEDPQFDIVIYSEWALDNYLKESTMSIKEVRDFVELVRASEIWQRSVYAHPRVEVVHIPKRVPARAKHEVGLGTLLLPNWAKIKVTVLHEMTHLIVHPVVFEPHGMEFCKYLLKLIREFMGEPVHYLLKDSYQHYGVSYKGRDSNPVLKRRV
jgi:putative metallohydrolase (TIGR04338 family)